MKTIQPVLVVLILLIAISGNGQTVTDSVRTRNDKPGTPQSLRSSDKSPQSHVKLIHTKGANQNVIQTTSEGNNVNNTHGQTIITNTNSTSNIVPKSPVTLQTTPVKRGDTSQKISLGIKVSNASNPIRN